MNKIFRLVAVDSEQVVIKIDAKNNLDIALCPYISGNYDYITVTRGAKHTLTVVNKDGSTFSFHWGIGGHTIISDNLKRLKKEVVKFIEIDCKIMLELTTDKITKATIYFNNNFNKWQLTVNNAHIWSDDAKCLEDMIVFATDYVGFHKWEHSIAVTGIDVWEAVM